MADEQLPPKRDVNELFTLDASEPTWDPDGPLGHLLSASPVADLTDSSGRGDGDSGGDELPSLSDVSGLEDLYLTTNEVPPGDRTAEASPDEPVPGTPPVEPGTTRVDQSDDSDLFRSFEVGGNLRFSKEATPPPATIWSSRRNDHPYPARLVPTAVPSPVAPARTVRVPGEERRRGALFDALADVTERRWFWASASGFFGLVLFGLLTISNIVPNPLAAEGTGVVIENRLPAAPSTVAPAETSEPDTSSSTGAGSGPFEPTTTVEATTSSTSTASTRRVVTTARPTPRPTARPTVRSTTRPVSSTSTTASSTSSSVSSTATTVGSSTTDPSSSTTDPSSSTTDPSSSTTDPSSSTTETTDNPPTTEDTTTTEDSGSPTT